MRSESGVGGKKEAGRQADKESKTAQTKSRDCDWRERKAATSITAARDGKKKLSGAKEKIFVKIQGGYTSFRKKVLACN